MQHLIFSTSSRASYQQTRQDRSSQQPTQLPCLSDSSAQLGICLPPRLSPPPPLLSPFLPLPPPPMYFPPFPPVFYPPKSHRPAALPTPAHPPPCDSTGPPHAPCRPTISGCLLPPRWLATLATLSLSCCPIRPANPNAPVLHDRHPCAPALVTAHPSLSCSQHGHYCTTRLTPRHNRRLVCVPSLHSYLFFLWTSCPSFPPPWLAAARHRCGRHTRRRSYS